MPGLNASTTSTLFGNLDIVFFFYGLAFIALGLIVFSQTRGIERSGIRLTAVLPLLGWFGLIHGGHELFVMFSVIKGDPFFVRAIAVTLLAASYLFLFLFGCTLINIGLRVKLGGWLVLVFSFLFVGLPALVQPDSLSVWAISARYFLGFVGGVLATIGLPLYYQADSEILSGMHIKKYFISASAFFALYAVMAGLIVPAAEIFPASAINEITFISLFGVPVQIFRAVAAVGLSWSFWKILDIFNIEQAANQQRAEADLRDAHNELEDRVERRTDQLSEANALLQDEITYSKRLTAVVESTSDFVGIADSNNEVVFINKAGRKMTGIGLGEDITQYRVPDFHPSWAAKVVLEEGIPEAINKGLWSGETALKGVNGAEIPVSQLIQAHRGPNGQIELSTISRNIEESKKAERTLRASEEKYRNLFEHATDAIYLVDPQTTEIVECNERAAQMVGYSRDELREMTVKKIHPEEDWLTLPRKFKEIARQGFGATISEVSHKKKDGEVFPVEINAGAIEIGGRQLNLVIVRDLTERKKAEHELRQKDHDIRKAYADVFGAVTQGKLLILTLEEIKAALGEPCCEPYRITSFEQLTDSREFLRRVLKSCDQGEDSVSKLIMASGEATANGVKHGGSCEIQVNCVDEIVQITISDGGPGIDFTDLPKATLVPGYSTKKSLGFGFTMILDLVDRVLLSTGAEGTTITLETGGRGEGDELEDILSGVSLPL